MWLIISGAGDIDYTRVFGPFGSKQDATAALPEDDDDTRWRTVELEAPEGIIHMPEIFSEESPVQVQVADPPQGVLDALVARYGDIANIPGPNREVRAYAMDQIQRIKQHLSITVLTADYGRVQNDQAQLIFFEELARQHRPRIGF